MKKRGRLIVISAPSGCGKTTIVKRLLERNKDLSRSISFTTRPPRPDEESGKDYFFVSQEEFSEKERGGFFLESVNLFGCSYGTSKQLVSEELSRGRDVVLAIDVQGMKKLRERGLSEEFPVVSIFIMPPSREALKRRLMKRRTETKDEINYRLHIAEEEIQASTFYDHIVVNHRIDRAVKEIEEVLKW